MSVLSGKNILLGISGGIAAYKIPFLIRLLVKKTLMLSVLSQIQLGISLHL